LRLGLAGHNLNLSGLWINLETGHMQSSSHSSFEGAGYVLLSEAGGYAGHGSEAQLWAHVSVWRFVGMPHIDNVCAFIVRAQVVHGIAELGEADLGLAYDQVVFR
jgi:hypothetical protein